MSSNETAYERVCRALKGAQSKPEVREFKDRANETEHVVRVNGKLRIEGYITLLMSQYELLKVIEPSLLPVMPSHCFDPEFLAQFFGIPLEELGNTPDNGSDMDDDHFLDPTNRSAHKDGPLAMACGNTLVHTPAGLSKHHPEGDAGMIMSEGVGLLKSLDRRLASIERMMSKPNLDTVLRKSEYTVTEVAQLSQDYGTTKYGDWAVRFACSEGRIPDARKLENGQWRLAREVVLRILEEGIPPEKRPR